MAEDFRTLLKESGRNGEEERFFEALVIGDWFIMDIQASPLHDCSPAAILDDPMDYENFQVNLSTQTGAIAYGSRGAWLELKDKPWASYFSQYAPFLLEGAFIPPEDVQQIYEDLIEYADSHE